MLPKISIITVCYNAETLIERTIESVFNQTYSNIEYIIIDGKSTDNTLKIIKTYKEAIRHCGLDPQSPENKEMLKQVQHDKIVLKILSEPDNGIYDAMNKGLSLATGDYVWFINAGDEIYESTTLENLIICFKQNANVVYGDMMRVNEFQNTIGLAKQRPPKKFTWKSFRMGMTVCHQSILVARKIAPKYDLQYKICADIDWVIRAMKQAQIVCNSQQILSRYLIGGFSQQREKKVWKERFTVMLHHYGLFQTLVFHVFIGVRYVFKGK